MPLVMEESTILKDLNGLDGMNKPGEKRVDGCKEHELVITNRIYVVCDLPEEEPRRLIS